MVITDLGYSSYFFCSGDGAITSTFDVTSSSGISFLEHVVVAMSLSLSSYETEYDYSDYEYEKENYPGNIYNWLRDPHPKRGDIQITLTSPYGTTSTLLPYRLYDFINKVGYDNWPFMSVHYWGENPVGRWTIRIDYRSSSGTLSMQGLSMKLYGTTVTPKAVSNIPSRCDPACQGACSGPGPDNCDICSKMRVAQTQECVSACPNGSDHYKSYCFVDQSTNVNNLVITIVALAGGLILLLAIVIGTIVTIVLCCRKKSRTGSGPQFRRLEPIAT
jgi:hypothetical protein